MAESRKDLTFEQAEGAAPLPEQLKLKELNRALRACLWHDVHQALLASSDTEYSSRYFVDPWHSILKDMHARRYHKASDDFSNRFDASHDHLKRLFWSGNYIDVFAWLQWVLRHPLCPASFRASVATTLESEHAAYRVIDGDTICPIGSEQEIDSFAHAVILLGEANLDGARAHLKNAAVELSEGDFAGSVRESIHAVESVARTLAPGGELGKALARLEKSANLHSAMRAGFASLYGYTSDEGGIRHAMLEDGAPKVDETDALFMLGACASFVTYLVNKARLSGLIDSGCRAGSAVND